nr:protein esc1 [Quercus suber]
MESRRSSVDSRMHQGFSNMYINNSNNIPGSPYENGSQNGSHTSLAQNLRRPGPGGPMSPLSGRSSLRGHPAPRIAPPIAPAGQRGAGADPTASRPTPGHAWAFPDEAIPEERRGSDSEESSFEHSVSRANSFAASSIRSSIFSNDSQMPQGQRRFDDGDPQTHHHSMGQHRTIQSLQNENMSGQGVGNYSRTPELRVSHKLAERKRRSEMKDLFEELNKAVPSSGGTKASKWEILTKDYTRDSIKENEMLKTEIQVMHQNLRRLDPNAPHVYGHLTSQLQHGSSGGQSNGTSNIALPPLAPTQPPPPVPFNGGPPAPMQGVEYGDAAALVLYGDASHIAQCTNGTWYERCNQLLGVQAKYSSSTSTVAVTQSRLSFATSLLLDRITVILILRNRLPAGVESGVKPRFPGLHSDDHDNGQATSIARSGSELTAQYKRKGLGRLVMKNYDTTRYG